MNSIIGTRKRLFRLVGALALAALVVSLLLLTDLLAPARSAGAQGSLAPAAASSSAATEAMSTTFTYQGRLQNDDGPVTGTCDFQFALYAASSGGSPLATADRNGEPVTNGYFDVGLDFGADAFAGQRRWLGIQVKCGSETSYADLGRQELTATPNALYATSTGALHRHPVSITAPTSGQVLKWDGTQWAPAEDEMGSGGTGDITAVHAGDGLTGGGDAGEVTLNADFAGSGGDYGTADTVARSDHRHDATYSPLGHDHDGVYSPVGHTHPGSDITSAVPTATLALSATQASWSGLTGIPGYIADGDDDTLGALSCGDEQIVRWNGSVWICSNDGEGLTDVQGGDGLIRTAARGVVTLTVDFAGSGSAITVAHSDHHHDGAYVNDDAGEVDNADVPAGGLSPDRISGTAWTGNNDGSGTGLDADLLDGQQGSYYRDAANINAGTLGTDRYSAHADLSAEGYLDNDAATDLLTRGQADSRYCSLTGNSGTTYGTHILGTTDAVSLTLAVNGAAALRLEPHATSPNLIGGHGTNSVDRGAYGATVGGGGSSGYPNRVTDYFGTVGGGRNNQAGDGSGSNSDASYATVGGGWSNVASEESTTVGGGWDNVASGYIATVGGGYSNDGSGSYATVPGGYDNTAEGHYSFAAGRHAQALHRGAFVWADSTDTPITSTTDNQFLVRASGGVVFTATHGALLRLEPNTYSPNLIGGYGGNGTTSGTHGATIGGGGQSGWINRVTDHFGTVAGGARNRAGNDDGAVDNRQGATVGGGVMNTASGQASTVSGGYQNTVSGGFGTIGGGSENVVTGTYGTVPGGRLNSAQGSDSFAAGRRAKANHAGAFVWADSSNYDFASSAGDQFSIRATGGMRFVSGIDGSGNPGTGLTLSAGANTLDTIGTQPLELHVNGDRALRLEPDTTSPNLIGGYIGNSVDSGVVGATIGGGGDSSYPNTVTDNYGTVGGGRRNQAGDGTTSNQPYATVGGGYWNTAGAYYATVAGGYRNTAGNSAFVGGGFANEATGQWSAVPGGEHNEAAGHHSFAAGYLAKAKHDGAFVWGDDNTGTWGILNSPAENTFIVDASGGIWFGDVSRTTAYTPTIGSGVFISTSTGAYLSTGGNWVSVSDANAKENFTPVDSQEILARVAELPVTTWNYTAEDPSVRHMGPVAQDFHAAFGLGQDDRHIAALDASGVALAAVQGLHEVSQEQAAHIEELETENAALQQELDDLAARVAALEQATNSEASSQPLENDLLPGAGILLVGLVFVLSFSRRKGGVR